MNRFIVLGYSCGGRYFHGTHVNDVVRSGCRIPDVFVPARIRMTASYMPRSPGLTYPVEPAQLMAAGSAFPSSWG